MMDIVYHESLGEIKLFYIMLPGKISNKFVLFKMLEDSNEVESFLTTIAKSTNNREVYDTILKHFSINKIVFRYNGVVIDYSHLAICVYLDGEYKILDRKGYDNESRDEVLYV